LLADSSKHLAITITETGGNTQQQELGFTEVLGWKNKAEETAGNAYHDNGIVEVRGSIPLGSTRNRHFPSSHFSQLGSNLRLLA
jgi:hypothetical protein